MKSPTHVYSQNLVDEVQVPTDGITSRAIHNSEDTRVVIFAFDQGQELSEHTASMPAILHVLQGEAVLTFGEESREAGPGSWAYMPAHLPHSVVAKTPVILLLTLQKSAKGAVAEAR
jgi:quercetin dioxygenase-like cupin family protein